MRRIPSFGLHGPWRIDSSWTRRRLRTQLGGAISRARCILLPATLTFEEWIITIDHFGGLCAYCKTRPFLVLEHVVPILSGGGTTPGNCLPACNNCNAKKGNRPIREVFPEVAGDLEAYLSRRSTGADTGRPPQDVIRFRENLAREVRWMSNIHEIYFVRRPVEEVLRRWTYFSMLNEEEAAEFHRWQREEWLSWL